MKIYPDNERLNLEEHLNQVLREFLVASSKNLVPLLVAVESNTPHARHFNIRTTNYLLLRVISKHILFIDLFVSSQTPLFIV